MAGQDRTTAALVELLRDLQERPYEHDFFDTLRRLECHFPDRPRLGESARAKDDPVRLGQEPSLAFAPRTLASLKPGQDGLPPRLEVFFFGAFGPNGPLPIHLTEYARNRLRHHGDPTFARFLDIFHHRLLSLFYRAWANSQPTVSYDRPQSDRFAAYVGSLLGCGSPAMRGRDSVPDRAKLHFAGRLASAARHPEGLQAILATYLQTKVEIEEFVGQWIEIPEEFRCVIGRASPPGTLGVSASIGSRVRDCQLMFRIRIGPLSLADYQRLLPGGESLPRLIDLVRNYIGDELMWEANLVLRRDEAPPVELGRRGCLGWSCWLAPESLDRDPADLNLNPRYAALPARQRAF